MKNIKRIKRSKISPYYRAITRIISVATAIVLIAVLISGAYAPFGYFTTGHTYGNPVPILAFLLSSLITIGGGFLIGLFGTRTDAATKNERIIKAGAYGLLANMLYTAGHGFLLLLNVVATNTVVPTLTSFGPLIALVIIVAIAVIDRRNPSQAMKAIPGTFIAAFWLIQIWYVVQAIQGAPRSSPDDIVALVFTVPLIILIPLAIAVAFYAALRPIGKLTRAFYAIYLAALPFTFVLAGFGFVFGAPSQTSDIYSVVLQLVTLGLIAAVLTLLIRARRLKA